MSGEPEPVDPSASEVDATKPALKASRCALLTLIVGDGVPTYAYEVVKAARERGGVLGLKKSQIERALKALAEDGYLERKLGAAIKTRNLVATYQRTQPAFEAVHEWVGTPVVAPELERSEMIPRLRAARFVPPSRVLEGLAPIIRLLEDAADDLDRSERRAHRDGKFDDIMELEFDLQRAIIRVYQKWAERALGHLKAEVKRQTPTNDRSPKDVELFLKGAKRILG